MGTLSGGVATLNTTALPAGSDAVTASYAASGNFAAGASPATIIAVKGASQTITFPAIASRAYGSAPFAVGDFNAWAAVIRSRLPSRLARPQSAPGP